LPPHTGHTPPRPAPSPIPGQCNVPWPQELETDPAAAAHIPNNGPWYRLASRGADAFYARPRSLAIDGAFPNPSDATERSQGRWGGPRSFSGFFPRAVNSPGFGSVCV
jgi:hypothetical protein